MNESSEVEIRYILAFCHPLLLHSIPKKNGALRWSHDSTNSALFFCSSSVKPQILQHLENGGVQNGTSYKLNCSAYGDPALNYSWTINGNQNISNAVTINGGKTLHINQVTINNEGTYTCMVTNIEGKASTTANITIFGECYCYASLG
jgi:hypothetical protein